MTNDYKFIKLIFFLKKKMNKPHALIKRCQQSAHQKWEKQTQESKSFSNINLEG